MSETATTTVPTEGLLIERIVVREVCVPRVARNRITTTYGTLPDAHFALVEVHAEGLVGVGEAATDHWWTGEDAATVRHAVETYLAPALTGHRLGVRAAASVMHASLFGHPHAKAAVEMALWDLLAQVAGLPLATLLGGGGPRPVPLKYVIGILPPDAAAREAEAALALGFRQLKIKVGLDLDADLARVRAVQAAAGGQATVGVDAQLHWDFARAALALPRLEALDVRFLEQPVHRDAEADFAEITARSAIPTIAHESVLAPERALANASRRVARIWSLTPCSQGGLLNALDILSVARLARIPCLFGGTVELGVATAFLAHVASAFDEIALSPVGSDLIGPLYHEDDVVDHEFAIADGELAVPSGPGTGVRLDPDKLERFVVGAR